MTDDESVFLLGKEPGLFDVMIVNDNLEEAYGHLKQALLEVSHCCRTHKTQAQLLQIG